MIIINPSILSADFNNMESEIKRIEKSDTNMIHIDIMDGVFVPNITFGMSFVKSLRKITNLTFDVHLMIKDPIRYIDEFAESGADIISFHYEACDNPKKVIERIHKNGKKVALAIKPNTKVEAVYQFLDSLDMVLIMTVYPGFSGQKFISEMLDKIETLKNYIKANGYKTDIEVDGGINSETVVECVKKGANVAVSGSTLFNADDFATKLKEMKTAAEKNYRG